MAKAKGVLDALNYFLDANEETELREKAWDAFNKAKEALDRAKEEASDAAAALALKPTSISRRRRFEASQRSLRQRKRSIRENVERLREFRIGFRRTGKQFIRGFQGRNVGGALQRGAEAAGPAGAIVGGAAELAGGISTGMALAFGGPYGPLIAQGIKMFGGLVSVGFKFTDSMNKWANETDQRTAALAQASPHMFAVQAQRQFLNALEDMQRGAALAGSESLRNTTRAETRRSERIGEINERHIAQRWETVEDHARQIRGQTTEGLVRSGNRITAMALNAPGVSHAFDWLTRGAYALQEAGIVRQGENFRRFRRDMDALQEQQRRELAEASRNVDLDRATRPDANLFARGGFFDLVRPQSTGGEFDQIVDGRGVVNSMTEQVLRLGMGGNWASEAGLPDRWRIR